MYKNYWKWEWKGRKYASSPAVKSRVDRSWSFLRRMKGECYVVITSQYRYLDTTPWITLNMAKCNKTRKWHLQQALKLNPRLRKENDKIRKKSSDSQALLSHCDSRPWTTACFWFMCWQSCSCPLPEPMNTWLFFLFNGLRKKQQISAPGEVLMSRVMQDRRLSKEPQEYRLDCWPEGFSLLQEADSRKTTCLKKASFRKFASFGKLHFPPFSLPWPYLPYFHFYEICLNKNDLLWSLSTLPCPISKNLELYFTGNAC